MLLNSLHIKGFRSFEDFRVEGFGQVNLIIGKNNAGKTSLLEAIYLYRAKGGDPLIPINRGEDLLTSQLNLFYGRPSTDSTGSISIESDQPARFGLELKNSMIRLVNITLGAVDFMVGRSQFAIPATAPVLIAPATNGGFSIERAWERIQLTPYEEDVAVCLRLVLPTLERVAMVGNTPKVRLRGGTAPITMASLGEGITRLFHIGCGLVTSSNEVCLIEEPETGIHHTVHADMWRFIFAVAQRYDIQVFATTHGLDCLRGFAAATRDFPEVSGRVIRLENRKGAVASVMFDEDEARIAAREEIEIR